MAFDAYDDYEQSELVQKWLRQNGMSIVVGIVVGLIAIFGWQQWRNHQAAHQMDAAQLYQQMQTALALGQTGQADKLEAQLQKDYADSAYAVFAAGERAQQQVQAKQLDKALASLAWAESHAGDTALKSLVELRMARVQLAAGQGATALSTLDRVPAKTYDALKQELRGDVLVKLGRKDDARNAYQAAIGSLDEQAPQRGALQLKLDDLAVAGKQGA
jgi:predicted negative regulator of RcsB-dependent stress response